jgi:pimeloyl-ACP methyl ester carboxylesterase
MEAIQVEKMTTMKDGLVEANGARIHYEVRGSGPPLLLIMGLTGDAGWFEPLAKILAEQFTVITYDRRGNSRSPRPKGWTSTSVAEQADDAAGLLSALRLSPAIVFGNSFGAMILLDLIAHHPRAVRGAIVHEPPLLSILHQSQEVADFWKAKVVNGGPRYALNVFTGMKGDEAINGLDPSVIRRAFENGEVIFSVEMPVIISYEPNVKALKGSKVPILVAAGEETAMYLFRASSWLATQLRTDLHMLPGGHVGYADRPNEFATALLPLLEKLR